MKARHLRPEDLAGRRWAGWLRESSADQADAVVRQSADIERAAGELGMVGPVRWYSRVGSGEAEGMTELARALADGKAGAYDVLVVFHTSRFARNRAEATRMKAEFRKAGVVIYFVAQRMISGTYQSGLSEGVSEVIDEHENETRRLWIAGGHRERQKAGRWLGNIPYGYRRRLADFPDGTRGWDGGLVPDPVESPILRRIVGELLAGHAPRDIAFSLNADGIRTRDGGPWAGIQVRKLGANPVYTGKLVRYRHAAPGHYFDESDPHDGRLVVAGDWTPIVSDAEHDAIEAAITQRRLGGTGARFRSYPMTKSLRCACGRRMSGVNNGKVRYYRCSGRAAGTDCTQRAARADAVEASFADWLSKLRLPSGWREAIARTQLTSARGDEDARKAKLEERLARIKKLYSWGDLTDADYRAQAAELRAELAVTVKPAIDSIEEVARLLEDVGSTWRSAPGERQSALPNALLAYGEVRGESVEWVARAELRALLELCVEPGPCLEVEAQHYTLRYSVA